MPVHINHLAHHQRRAADAVNGDSFGLLDAVQMLHPTNILAARAPIYSSPGNSYGSGGGSSIGGSSSSGGDGTDNGSIAKKGGNNSELLAIILSIVIPVSLCAVLLLVLHRRATKRVRKEDLNYKHGSLDFGLGEGRRLARKKNGKGPEMGEKPGLHRGLSMDMMSPYLVSDVQGRSSFGSEIARSMSDGGPYVPSDMIRANSRSPSRTSTGKWSSNSKFDKKGPFLSTKALPSPTTGSTSALLPNAQPSAISTPPRTAESTAPSSPTHGTPLVELPEAVHSVPSRKPVVTSKGSPPLPTIAEPEAVQAQFDFSLPTTNPAPLAEMDASPAAPRRPSPSPPPPVVPQKNANRVSVQPTLEVATSFHDEAPQAGGFGLAQTTAPNLHLDQARDSAPPAIPRPGLSVPSQTPIRRISAGVRPLPPEDPQDNAEQRANRIRSFYKEYFDDSRNPQTAQYEEQYYEEDGYEYNDDDYYYDPEELGYEYGWGEGAPIWDSTTGEFVMAGGEYPVTRRAMTPPARTQGMRNPRTRAFSTASGGRPRGPGGPRGGPPRGRPAKRLPPPKPLNNLPTPHLLGGDVTLMALSDFAPPIPMRERVAGRSQSPKIGARPYTPPTRGHTPMISPFNELQSMPSPSQLGKNDTIDWLDFAPPKFRNPGGSGQSDSGSIRSGRSNNSGLSRMNAHNIRAGAYRLSRMPRDVVGTKDDLAMALKPSWDLKR